MTAIPAGWGFRSDLTPETPAERRERRQAERRAKYQRTDDLERYARTLSTRPTAKEVMAHFGCHKRTAYRYLHVIRMFVR